MYCLIVTNNKNKKVLPFGVVFEDNQVIVVNKPSGLLTIATNKEKDKNARVFIVHRLDKDTSYCSG